MKSVRARALGPNRRSENRTRPALSPNEQKIKEFYTGILVYPMPTRKVNLTKALDRFVTSRIESGRYENASEVMRAGLHALQEREQAYLRFMQNEAAVGFAELDRAEGIRGTPDEIMNRIDEWPANEPDKSRIERGLRWASRTPAKETDLAALVAKAKHRRPK